jgi:putative CocE/NonD family hydrolase
MPAADVVRLKVGQPAWSTQWYGIIEAGDSKRLVANGYVHVIGQIRGGHKSEGMPMDGGEWDEYDTFEWMCAQPWCDGNIGMIGLSGYSATQWKAAAQQHPALKAIFPGRHRLYGARSASAKPIRGHR